MKEAIDVTLGKSTVRFYPSTGEFRWVEACRKPYLAGELATYETPNGYLYIFAGGKRHSASRLAYELYYGQTPGVYEVDHVNRVKTDNRPSNLRLVTREGNLRNRKFKPNRLGVTGVSLHKGGLFRARYKSKVTYHKSLEEAADAYLQLFHEETTSRSGA